MVNFMNLLIDNSSFPLLVAFFLGILMALSPCALTTNIAAIAYISKRTEKIKTVILDGLFYSLGRLVSYTLLATLIYFGLSGFQIGRFLQFWGDKILGPILIIIALAMLGLIRINLRIGNGDFFEKIKSKMAQRGSWGAFLLGVLFALAFCPYGGILFFAVLIPMVLSTPGGLLLAPAFSIGSALPVILFAFIIAFSFKSLNKAFKKVQKAEKIIRYLVSFVFLGVGIYYTYFLFIFLNNLIKN